MPRDWTASRSAGTIVNVLDADLGWLRGWSFLYVPDPGKADQVAVQVRQHFPRGVVVIDGHPIEAAGGRRAVEEQAARLRVAWERHEPWEGTLFASVLWIGSLDPGEPAPEAGIPVPAVQGLITPIKGPLW